MAAGAEEEENKAGTEDAHAASGNFLLSGSEGSWCLQLRLLGANFARVPGLFTEVLPSLLSHAKFQNAGII